MLAYELINEDIPSLKPTDTTQKVLDWMEDFRISHLPVVNKRKFLGMVSYTDMLDQSDGKNTLGNAGISYIKSFVRESYHVFDVLKVIAEQNVSAVAVLNAQDNYIGLITAESLLHKIAKLPFVNEPGGLIILELNIRDYSLSQIAQIVEGNDAKILTLYINAHTDTTKIELTIKINRTDLTPILQTFARYNYMVKASYYQASGHGDLKDRFDEFMHYLNI